MLEVEGLAARYGRTRVVWDVSLTVAPGRLVTLIGANGAGKTTTLNTICGILPAAAGRVRFLGEDIARLRAHERVRRGLVQVPEGREIFGKLTVRENLELAAWTRRDGGVEASIREVMERFPVLGERRHQRAGALSGGEQQMLAIGRGLMARPKATLVRLLPLAVIRPIAREALTAYTGLERAMYTAGAILFNANGDRFTNERDRPEPAVAAQPGQKAWLLLDSALARRFSRAPHAVSTAPGIAWAYFPDYERARPDIIHAGATVLALAARVGVDGARLAAAVHTYNRAMAGAEVDPFGRPVEGPGLRVPPFFAMGPVTPRYVIADGGLLVDTCCRVLGRNDRPIPGLFAVGCTGTGGLVLAGHGLHLGWAFTSGRIAGRVAATGNEREPTGGG